MSDLPFDCRRRRQLRRQHRQRGRFRQSLEIRCAGNGMLRGVYVDDQNCKETTGCWLALPPPLPSTRCHRRCRRLRLVRRGIQVGIILRSVSSYAEQANDAHRSLVLLGTRNNDAGDGSVVHRRMQTFIGIHVCMNSIVYVLLLGIYVRM